MSVETLTLSVGTLEVTVIRKAIKNLHIGVYPPCGAVRVAAPADMTIDAIRTALLLRLSWIRRQVSFFAAQEREPARDYVSGETHWLLGRRYRLRVSTAPRSSVRLAGDDYIELRSPETGDQARLARTLDRWLRSELRARAEPLVDRWSERLGVTRPHLGIRKMRTRWGTCNANAGRIWLNSALVRVAPPSIEYVIAHEIAHLIIPDHGPAFVELLDHHCPSWQHARDALADIPYVAERSGRSIPLSA